MSIIGIMRATSPESEDYARINNRVNEIETDVNSLTDNALTVNGEFDDTAGWWKQMQGDDKRDDSVFVHKRQLVENFQNKEVSPAIVTQTLVSYSHDGGQNFTRMSNSYHELIVSGTANVGEDSVSPNFTPAGTTVFNKAKGCVGVNGIIARVDDVHYSDSELGTLGASKSCGMGSIVSRRADYAQGRTGLSYSIGIESVVYNLAEEDGIEGTAGYFGNPDIWSYDTWTNCLHLVGGSRRPVTAGILINGKSSMDIKTDSNGKPVYDAQDNVIYDNGIARTYDHLEYVRNGMYSGIYIGASAMRIRSVPVRDSNGNLQYDTNGNILMTSGNSHLTAGINTSNWTENGSHGFTILKSGYAPRILTSRGSALFETPGAKFLNSKGSMPVAISCVDTYTYKDDNNQTQTAHGTPYLDFKIGSDSDFYNNSIPLERPTDTTRARIGYLQTTNSMNLSSDGSMKFNVARDFSSPNTTGKIYTMTETDFSPSAPVNLGTSANKWDNVYANTGTINTSDRNFKQDIQDIDERLLRAWGKVNYKIFRFVNGIRLHIGLIAQDIDEAFKSEGLNARDYGLFCEDVDENGNKILGVRYSECLALECAYLRNRLGA